MDLYLQKISIEFRIKGNFDGDGYERFIQGSAENIHFGGYIYKPTETSIIQQQIDPVDLRNSPDFVMLYGVKIKNCMIKIMKFMIPFTPHLAHECLSNLNCDEFNTLPKIDKKISGKFKNKTFMFTGKLEGISRAEAKSIIEKDPLILAGLVVWKIEEWMPVAGNLRT